MGRLLRKKPPDKKKGRKRSANSVASSDVASETKTTSSFDSAEDAKKWQVLSQKKPSGVATPAPDRGRGGYLSKGLQFLREVKTELKKVTWPSREQTISSTVVVIIFVIIISLFLGLSDVGLSGIVRMILH